MKKAKKHFLNLLNNHFERINNKVKKNLENGKDMNEESIKQIKYINDYYMIAQKYPVWPFNIKVVYMVFLQV